MEQRWLGIEIGGTKLQLAIGATEPGILLDLRRESVDVGRGADGILNQIERMGTELLSKHHVQAVGVGFGGPVDSRSGRVTTSHQISGWDGVELGPRLAAAFGCPVWVENDCNVAALAEARCGAARHAQRVFYVTVGTGIGGGFVVDGVLQGSERPAIAEIGHLRPGLEAVDAGSTVESLASGWGIAENARRLIQNPSEIGVSEDVGRQLIAQSGGLENLNAEIIAAAAKSGNSIANRAWEVAMRTLGWAIAQTITLLAVDTVVVGGGVSLTGEFFFDPLREQVACYVFPPLRDSYRIESASLGEEVVLHGAILLAQTADKTDPNRT